ncbi:DNA replication complex GINS protein [Musa troglodytarum]|uniref:DNA replication complex GINS protein n=1 Tax=Musa troglodytarum TaxID=320322 RepID=A0A9E7KX71_9LILI|nr:DNA replication complex GINS protein [Musa troglodytarum]
MYGRSASQLLKEQASCESGQLTVFNNEAFDRVIKECDEHHLQLESLFSASDVADVHSVETRKLMEQNLDVRTTTNGEHLGAFIHHHSLLRNKRCLMAYMQNRAEIVRSLRWQLGPVLPEEIKAKMSYSEEVYFVDHSNAIESYMSEMDVDLTADMVPPKSPSVQVKVLDDIGDVCLGDHSISLTKDSLHSLRRTDAEPFISQGLMEELLD